MARPSAIIDIIHSGEAFEVAHEVKLKPQRKWDPLDLKVRHYSPYYRNMQKVRIHVKQRVMQSLRSSREFRKRHT